MAEAAAGYAISLARRADTHGTNGARHERTQFTVCHCCPREGCCVHLDGWPPGRISIAQKRARTRRRSRRIALALGSAAAHSAHARRCSLGPCSSAAAVRLAAGGSCAGDYAVARRERVCTVTTRRTADATQCCGARLAHDAS